MRTTPSLFFLSAGTALSLTGCFYDSMPGPGPAPAPEPLPLASSFEVLAKVTFPSSNDPSSPPVTEDLVVRLDDAADGSVVAVLGSGSRATSATFARNGARLTLSESGELPVTPVGAGTFDARLIFASLELVPADTDGDGSADTVEGSGSGRFSQVYGDVQDDMPFTIEMSGRLDETAPYLQLSVTSQVHVMDGLTVLASEPLRRPESAQISVDGKVIPLEMFPSDAPYVTRFRTRSILPFASEVAVRIEPEPQDLAGFGVELGLERIETIPDPGLFAEDGFEGELAAVSSGVEVVTGFGTLPAIGGTRSLLFPESWSKVTMRVPIEDGDTHVRFAARALFESRFGFGCLSSAVRVGFPALDQIQSIYPAWNMEIEEDTGDERWDAATPVTTVELALPEGAGDELIFDIVPLPAQVGPPCPEAALLIDDLRVE